jgi:hypothetical protein
MLLLKSREAAILWFNTATIISLCEAKKIWWRKDLEGDSTPSKSTICRRQPEFHFKILKIN